MSSYLIDDDAPSIEWSDIGKVIHLDPTKTYLNLLNEINTYLDPQYILDLSFDYESMHLLLNQAKQFNIPFINNPGKLAIFILKNKDSEIKSNLLADEGFLEPQKTAGILDPHVYKRICNFLEKNNDISSIQNYRHLLLERVLSDELLQYELLLTGENYYLDVTYLFDEHFKKREESTKSNLYHLDLIANYFFDDYYENVYLDIKQMIKYTNLTNNDKIPQDRMAFYEAFADLKDNTYLEHQEFFEMYKDINIMEEFYDDIRSLKDESYQSLIDACTNFTQDSPLYNKELSTKYGCEVYYLNGEEFHGFVRSDVRISKYDIELVDGEPKLVPQPQPSPEQLARLGHSFTYIGTDDIQTYQHPNEKLTMLYTGIKPETIGHVYHNDSWSSPNYYYYSDYQNELHTPDSLLQESTKYPEILITELNNIKPIAILCLDAVTEWDIECSKRNNLPIVVINTLKYERKIAKEDHFIDHYTR